MNGHPAPGPAHARGRYHTDRQPGAALQNTAMCPAGKPAAGYPGVGVGAAGSIKRILNKPAKGR